MASEAQVPPRKRGRPKKREEQQAFSLRLPTDLHQQLRHYAIDQHVALNDVIVRAIEEWWARVPDRNAYQRFVDRPVRKK